MRIVMVNHISQVHDEACMRVLTRQGCWSNSRRRFKIFDTYIVSI
ncbi:MAG: hypothetical protein JWQ49_39 [Edaphobacter sp.]|nr:hypothetical protein [Edaphobacter sp.]